VPFVCALSVQVGPKKTGIQVLEGQARNEVELNPYECMLSPRKASLVGRTSIECIVRQDMSHVSCGRVRIWTRLWEPCRGLPARRRSVLGAVVRRITKNAAERALQCPPAQSRARNDAAVPTSQIVAVPAPRLGGGGALLGVLLPARWAHSPEVARRSCV